MTLNDLFELVERESASDWLERIAPEVHRQFNEMVAEVRANAFGTGLGGPEMDPSPSVSALRAPSLSQVSNQGTGAAQEAARRIND